MWDALASACDARVFQRCSVFQLGQAGTLFPPNNLDIKRGSAYYYLGRASLLPWLMKLYPAERVPGRVRFNDMLSSRRVVRECAFGPLKTRWCLLPTHLDTSASNTIQVIEAFCALHNRCEEQGENSCQEGTDACAGTGSQTVCRW